MNPKLQPSELHSACKRCLAYCQAESPFLAPVRLGNREDLPTVLILSSSVSEQEDSDGKLFVGEAEEMLTRFAKANLESANFILLKSTLCFHPKPYGEEYFDGPVTECSRFVYNYIKACDAKAVIVAGYTAMKSILGVESEVTLQEARLSDADEPEMAFWNKTVRLFYTYHPTADYRYCNPHNRDGAMDLFPEYYRVFKSAVLEAGGKLQKLTDRRALNKEVVVTKKRARQIVKKYKKHKGEVFFDVETGQSDNNPEALTMWHPGVKFLCCSFTIKEPKSEVRYTYVFARKVCKRIYIKGMLEGKKVVAHNIKFDAQVVFKFFKIRILEYLNFIDTFLIFNSIDQGRMSNSLKGLCAEFLAIKPWDSEMKELVEKAQARLDKKWKAGGKVGPRPIADYRNISKKKLHHYNALDTHNLSRLYYEVVVELYLDTGAEDSVNKELVSFLNQATLALARLERNGIPLDASRVEEYKKKNEEKRKKLLKEFDRNKYVRKAKALIPKSFKGNRDNPNGRIFLELLVEVTGITTRLTPKGRPSLKKEDVQYIANVDPVISEEDNDKIKRTKVQDVWWQVYKIRKTLSLDSKFYNSYPKYILEDGMIHPTFLLGKSDGYAKAEASDAGGTITGRIASKDPQSMNIENIDIVRVCFSVSALEGRELIGA